MSASRGWLARPSADRSSLFALLCPLFSVQTYCSAVQRRAVGWLMAKYRMSIVFAFGAQIDSVACLIWVIMSAWLLENIRKKGSSAPPECLCVSCTVCLLCDQRLQCGTNTCLSSKEIPYRGRGAHSHWIIRVPHSYDFSLRNGGNDLGCNHWTSRKAKNLQCIYLDLTSLYLLKGSVSCWMKTAWRVRSDISVKCAALCCSAVASLCLLLGFMISRVRLLLMKQRNSIKLVKLNRKFSIKFMVLMCDGLFWHWEICVTKALACLGFFPFFNLNLHFIHNETIY